MRRLLPRARAQSLRVNVRGNQREGLWQNLVISLVPCVNVPCGPHVASTPEGQERMLRKWARWGLIAGVVGAVVVGSASTAFAAVTTPNTNPFTVSADGAGKPQSFQVIANGFAPGASVFVEQCDGRAATDVSWSATEDCDLGSSPAPVIADGSGVATFNTSDPNHAFHPFRGQSPQGLFNCNGPDDAPLQPTDGVADWTNCQIRVSSNNSAATGDQSFLSLKLPGVPSVPTSVTASAGTGSATVSWTAPTRNNGSPVTAYVITPFDGFIALPPQRFNSTATKETVTGLQKGHNYVFVVAAANASGTGQNSAASNSVSPK